MRGLNLLLRVRRDASSHSQRKVGPELRERGSGEVLSTRGYRLTLDPPGGPLTIAAFGDRAVRTAAAHADRMVLDLVSPELAGEYRAKPGARAGRLDPGRDRPGPRLVRAIIAGSRSETGTGPIVSAIWSVANPRPGTTSSTVTNTQTSMSDNSAAIDGAAEAPVYANSGYWAERDQSLNDGDNFTH